MKPVLAIAGATGVAKTKVAIAIAKQTGSVLLPLDQLHRYAHLQEGTGLDLDALAQVDHFGYQTLSPWEVSGPEKYVLWLRTAIHSITDRPIIIEGDCTSYLREILACAADSIIGRIRVVALNTSPVESVNLERIKSRVSPEKVKAIVEETRMLEEKGFVSTAGLPLLMRCEELWKHPEHDDRTLAWAIRIAAKVYCPSYLALKGRISVAEARERIVRNVHAIQRYQSTRVGSILPREKIFAEDQVSRLIDSSVASFQMES
jgi:hypothetical protein